jgi:hypothetical protein
VDSITECINVAVLAGVCQSLAMHGQLNQQLGKQFTAEFLLASPHEPVIFRQWRCFSCRGE